MQLDVEEHPSLDFGALQAELPQLVGDSVSPDWLMALLSADVPAPLQRNEQARTAVRDMLRHGGFKPTGRSKPASEYLVKAVSEGRLGSINLPVDLGNVVSFHSGVPISVVDVDRTEGALRVGIAPADSRFVFNQAGQEIDVSGLLCLQDAQGPCANAVKDSMRTKTTPETRRVLCVVWGVQGIEPDTAAIVSWYRELLERAGAQVT